MNITMKYGEYKNNWDHCKTVKGSYNAEDKTIVVIVPDVIHAMSEIIPAAEIESYRAELVASGHPQFADTYHICEIYADEFRGASIDEFDCSAEDAEWMKKAIKIVNG